MITLFIFLALTTGTLSATVAFFMSKGFIKELRKNWPLLCDRAVTWMQKEKVLENLSNQLAKTPEFQKEVTPLIAQGLDRLSSEIKNKHSMIALFSSSRLESILKKQVLDQIISYLPELTQQISPWFAEASFHSFCVEALVRMDLTLLETELQKAFYKPIFLAFILSAFFGILQAFLLFIYL